MRSRTLDEWLIAHTRGGLLDLSLENFFICEFNPPHNKCWWDNSYKENIPLFMKDPNPFLADNTQIEGLMLDGQAGSWPHDKIPLLAQNNTLEYLFLSRNNLKDDEVSTLLENQKLRLLDLSSNNIADCTATFATNTTLQALYVPYNNITTLGATRIGLMSSLQILDISHNPLNDEAGEVLVKNCKSLTQINLERTGIGDKTVKALLANKNLTEIHVSWSDVGCVNKFRLWRAVKSNTKDQKKHTASSSAFFHAKPKKQQAERVPTPAFGLR